MFSRFQLDINEEQLAAWAHTPLRFLPEAPFSGRLYSHRQYPVLRISPLSHEPEICWMREGLIPSYAHDEEGAERRVEAHAESLTCISCYRSAFRRRRCLIPASLINECRHDPTGVEQPCSFSLNSGETFSLAAVWETWLNDEGHEVQTFAVITSMVASVLRPIFDRLPIVIPTTDHGRWLRQSIGDLPLDLLKPLSATELRDWKLMPCTATGEQNPPIP